MSRGKALIYDFPLAYSHATSLNTAISNLSHPGIRQLLNHRRTVETQSMGHPQRIHTYDDELHERRRHLAIVREPLDFEVERLKRLVEKCRDTVNP